MSAKEEDGLLMNLQKNLEREKYLRKEIQKLSEEKYEFWQVFRRQEDENAGKYLELMAMHRIRIHQLKRVRKDIMGQREEYVREFIDKDVICVSNVAHLEAVCFLKREGWTGKALIHHEEFAGELSKNNIPFILKAS